jgi:hypothetical protein
MISFQSCVFLHCKHSQLHVSKSFASLVVISSLNLDVRTLMSTDEQLQAIGDLTLPDVGLSPISPHLSVSSLAQQPMVRKDKVVELLQIVTLASSSASS